MFKVVEVQTSNVLVEVSTHEDASQYISDIEAQEVFGRLLENYGSIRRIQQELTIEYATGS